MQRFSSSPAFTLIELLVVIAIIGFLSTIVMSSLSRARGAARDARRVADVSQLTRALELYYSNYDSYPPNNPPAQDVGGWNVSYQPGFLQDLVAAGIVPTNPKDPINQLEAGFSFFGPKAGSYFYAYYNYPASYAATYGCSFNTAFSVIAIRQIEGGLKANTPKATCGTIPPGGCPNGGIANVCRDWSTEFDYSVMVRP